MIAGKAPPLTLVIPVIVRAYACRSSVCLIWAGFELGSCRILVDEARIVPSPGSAGRARREACNDENLSFSVAPRALYTPFDQDTASAVLPMLVEPYPHVSNQLDGGHLVVELESASHRHVRIHTDMLA